MGRIGELLAVLAPTVTAAAAAQPSVSPFATTQPMQVPVHPPEPPA